MTTSEIHLRRGVIEDAERLSRFASRTFYETFVGTATEEDLQAAIIATYGVAQQRQEISDPRASFILAECDGELVGFAHLTVEDANSIELNRIYVTIDHERHRPCEPSSPRSFERL